MVQCSSFLDPEELFLSFDNDLMKAINNIIVYLSGSIYTLGVFRKGPSATLFL